MSTSKPPRAADYLKGQSPTARGLEKKRRVLLWVLRWGYSSADIIRQVSGRDRSGYARKLAKEGLLREVKTDRNPGAFYVLTRDGLANAVQNSEDDLYYPEIDPSKVHLGQMEHYLVAQKVTINALSNEKISDYKTERMFSEGIKGEKRSDVIWVTRDGRSVGLEIELHGKWHRELDQFVFRVIASMQHQAGRAVQLDHTAIVSKSQSILARYKKAMAPGTKLKIWEKNASRNVWESNKTIDVPEWLIERIVFSTYE
jgi:hypothetical protein